MATTAFRNLIKKIQEEHPVLPDKKIKELLVQYRETGDLEVRDQIILSNVGLAMKYVSQYQYVNERLRIVKNSPPHEAYKAHDNGGKRSSFLPQ
jgi:hypothetical protein